MPNLSELKIDRIAGAVTKVAPELVGVVQATEVKNYENDPMGNLTRRAGSRRAILTDHASDDMDATWWANQWGSNDVDLLEPAPEWPPFMPRPYDPAARKPTDKLLVGGGGKVAQTETVPRPDIADHFDVSIPAAIPNGNPFNVTVTAKKADGSTDTGFTGAAVVSVAGWGTRGISYAFTQNTAPGSVSWTNGVATISCTMTAEAAPLASKGGCWMRVKVVSGPAGRGPISGESDRGWVTATGYLVVAASAGAVDVDEAFTLTVTAKKADGTTDTAYASATAVTEDNSYLTLQTAAGGAFSGFTAGQFTNGVASASVRLHTAGSLSGDQTVKLNAVKTGEAAPAGETTITVRATGVPVWQ
jgi:hypothetical protein